VLTLVCVQSGSVSPAFKVRRRTASDATWKNRPRIAQEPSESSEVIPGFTSLSYHLLRRPSSVAQGRHRIQLVQNIK